MLATLVIGLREGLEAALIVGIIAAFLRRNGKSLRPMWVGVAAAVLLSIAVGVSLEAVSVSLPQAQQEGLETVIGAIAIVFVTGMIVWMGTHARSMRRELEESATAALSEGSAWALAGMAFLAVLEEGFETSVFLLATFQSSTSVLAAAAGAVIGVLIAVAIGVGIYTGGVRLDLGKFFKATGVFLIFVAAGLVISALRTAHEAGWINIGQQRTLDLSWLAPNGSIQAALITGVLGIPADPRVIEVLGWLLYLLPVLAYSLWPKSLKPSRQRVPRVQFGFAGALALVAIVLALAVPGAPATAVPSSAPLVGASGADAGTARARVTAGTALLTVDNGAKDTIRFPSSERSTHEHATIAAGRWQRDETAQPTDRPRTLTIDDLVALGGNRLPVGIDAQRNPGPFQASWNERIRQSVWTIDGRLLDATSTTSTVVTISGGGLPTPRTVSVPASDAESWSVDPAYVDAVSAAHLDAGQAAQERLLWKLWLPLVLLIAALVIVGFGLRGRIRVRRQAAAAAYAASVPLSPTPSPITPSRSNSYAAK